eukprot:TRINITY_DN2484_c0_g1_i7.p1 TRINITY_DN2484_c0_g1~~TRINITY_DN2484_c0_g1_i7.p1  ORF type:complete len:184 (-),score=7.68 TRINITY_DN2484_c0_g1_i7:385-936(-)
MRTYEQLDLGGFGYDHLLGAPYSMAWPSTGPPEDAVPRTTLTNANKKQSLGTDPQRNAYAPQAPLPKNPMPSSGCRRDSCGRWSVGSEGHEHGLCQGPCKDVRSGRGCTYRAKCRRCHFPHPEVSSSSLRSKKSKAEKMRERSEYAWENGYYDRNGFVHGHSDPHPHHECLSSGQVNERLLWF